jgi:hypothetical protein
MATFLLPMDRAKKDFVTTLFYSSFPIFLMIIMLVSMALNLPPNSMLILMILMCVFRIERHLTEKVK